MIDEIFNRAKKSIKTIVLPEGNSCERVRKAGVYVFKNKIANVIFIGKENDFKKEIKLGIKVIDIEHFSRLNEMANMLYSLRKEKGMTINEANELIKNPVYFSTCLVKMGLADGLVCGAITSTADTIRPALQIIKTKKGIDKVSSCFLMFKKNNENNIYCIGDCAVNIMPTSDDLVTITSSCIDTFTKFTNLTPKVALLSYSTNSSFSKDDSVNKVKNAVRLLQNFNKNVIIEGEMQADCALRKEVALIKYPNSKIMGQANILIVPDLNSGNICYKLMQYFGNMVAVGPILQGLDKPVNDVSRGATTMEIALTIALTSLQCD
jgi:phosphate acetyltransferase